MSNNLISFDNIINDDSWNNLQTRSIDPYSTITSDKLNKLNSVYDTNGCCVITGLDLYIKPSDTELVMKIHNGMCIKDYVLITFNEDVVIRVYNSSGDFRQKYGGETVYIAIDYLYEKCIPPTAAKLCFITTSEYDKNPERYLKLHKMSFDVNGSIVSNSVSRCTLPKDNIVYDSILSEISSTATSAVENTLSSLGPDGIADLIGVYMRARGISVTDDYGSTKYYYLIKTIDKENFKDQLTILTNIRDKDSVWENPANNINAVTIFIPYDTDKFKTQYDILDKNDILQIESYEVTDGVTTVSNPIECVVNYIEYDSSTSYYTVYINKTGLPINGAITNLKVKKTNRFFYNKYVITQNQSCLLDVDTESYTTSVSKKSFNDKCSIKIYSDDDYFYIYAIVTGNISGNIEAYMSVYDTTKVVLCNPTLLSTQPSLSDKRLEWSSEDTHYKFTDTYINDHKVWNESNDGIGSGLDADMLDGKDSSYFAVKADMTGTIDTLTTKVDADIADLASFKTLVANTYIPLSQKHANNGVATLTNTGTVPDNELKVMYLCGDSTTGIPIDTTNTDPSSSTQLRLNINANLYASRVYNPAYKDVAECFETNPGLTFNLCKHRVLALDYESGKARLCRAGDRTLLGIASDTYGLLLGGTEELLNSNASIVPIAMCGTAWVDIEDYEENINYYGCLVGAGGNGYGAIVTRYDPYIGMIVGWTEGSSLVKVLVRTGF